MIIHWRARLNSVQNAVGYMIKPTIVMMFGGPTAPVPLQTVTLELASVTQPTITASCPVLSITASVPQPVLSSVTAKNDIT